jgi:hypothetical protein
MSDQQSAKSGGSNSGSNPGVTALLHLAGVILLLPGLCSVSFSIILIRGEPALRTGYYDLAGVLIQLTGLAMGVVGMGIIVFAILHRARGAA